MSIPYALNTTATLSVARTDWWVLGPERGQGTLHACGLGTTYFQLSIENRARYTQRPPNISMTARKVARSTPIARICAPMCSDFHMVSGRGAGGTSTASPLLQQPHFGTSIPPSPSPPHLHKTTFSSSWSCTRCRTRIVQRQ